MSDDAELGALAVAVGKVLQASGWSLVAAESCTGGWVAKLITDVSGSSGWFDRGFVTYSNAAKQAMLGVQAGTLGAHGAVSEETVREMAAGAIEHSGADISVAISGIAGPGGGSEEKPVGLVWLAWARRGGAVDAERALFPGSRDEVRRQAAKRALEGILERAQSADRHPAE